MKTLTLFMENLFTADFGSSEYQLIEKITIKSNTYREVIFSGSLLKEIVFEDIIFDNCTFFGTNFENCLFINCKFLNCKFQFSKLSDCNFESTSWENCMWGLTALKDSEVISSEGRNNFSFESSGTFTKTLNLNDFLELTA